MNALSGFKRRTSLVLALAFSTGALTACLTTQTTSGGAVGVERSQFVLVSSAEVDAAAAKGYAEVLAKAQKEGKLNRDAKQVARVRAIANRLIPQTVAFRQDAPQWKWEVNVIESDQINAWCMAGGKIAFYSALIEKLALTDDEIAAIMGHEIAHALREHSRERISQQLATSVGLDLISAGFGLSRGASDLAGMAANVAISLPYGRSHEVESDRIGVELAARAGYNPRAAISVWQKMSRAGGGSPPQLLSTHPSPENRIRDLEVYSARVQPLYEQASRR
ncbi:M48 family metallopeptidase [Limnobacter parvus]|uniref:M48 family metallopeptidase n=1 Tax=Limnobacter parvus TaxID=2939690 RepID=A0ABT1XHQ0_9BURK|nr:M48 family metallopeptidase [Limnobacter parvus]MCR2746818.1 M48 family metallopeptidase [Limnobacter parvus]